MSQIGLQVYNLIVICITATYWDLKLGSLKLKFFKYVCTYINIHLPLFYYKYLYVLFHFHTTIKRLKFPKNRKKKLPRSSNQNAERKSKYVNVMNSLKSIINKVIITNFITKMSKRWKQMYVCKCREQKGGWSRRRSMKDLSQLRRMRRWKRDAWRSYNKKIRNTLNGRRTDRLSDWLKAGGEHYSGGWARRRAYSGTQPRGGRHSCTVLLIHPYEAELFAFNDVP